MLILMTSGIIWVMIKVLSMERRGGWVSVKIISFPMVEVLFPVSEDDFGSNPSVKGIWIANKCSVSWWKSSLNLCQLLTNILRVTHVTTPVHVARTNLASNRGAINSVYPDVLGWNEKWWHFRAVLKRKIEAVINGNNQRSFVEQNLGYRHNQFEQYLHTNQTNNSTLCINASTQYWLPSASYPLESVHASEIREKEQ